jgi:hypothetical protein
MNVVRRLYRALNALQHGLVFRIVASLLALILVGAVFGPLLSSNTALATQSRALRDVLADANNNDTLGVIERLVRDGTIEAGGRTYGDADFAIRAATFIDSDGTIARTDALIYELLQDQIPAWAPTWLLGQRGATIQLAFVITVLSLLIIWIGLTIQYLLTAVLTLIPVTICWMLGSLEGILFFSGVGMLAFTFVLLMRTLLLVLSSRVQLLAVAHTVVKEASRTKISLVFIVIIIVALPFFPFIGDAEDPLRFRIQGFIASSLRFTLFMAAILTLFLACSTVAFEIRDRQIWQLMTKPVNRFQYLIGKWIGIVCINLVLLIVSSMSVYLYVQYMRTLPARSFDDRVAVDSEILAARLAADPTYSQLDEQQLRDAVNLAIENDPELRQIEDIPLVVVRQKADDIRMIFNARQRSVPPGTPREFIFRNLQNAPKLGDVMNLRYRFHILDDSEHEEFPATFIFNDDPDAVDNRLYVPTVAHSLPMTTDFVRPDGTLKLTIINEIRAMPGRPDYGSLNWEEGDLQILYNVSTFEWNFLRAMLLSWVKLAALAAIGIACATFLSFPVACLLAFTIAAAGLIAPYLATSLELYGPIPASAVDWSNFGMVVTFLFESLIEGIAKLIVFVVGGFGALRPTQALVEGRLITWGDVFWNIFRLGLLWSALSLIVGYLVMRSRELAVYSGQG